MSGRLTRAQITAERPAHWWNWCPHCCQLVDADDVFAGTSVRCDGCRRVFVCECFTGIDGSQEWKLLEQRPTRKKARRNRNG